MNHHIFRVLISTTPSEVIKAYNVNPAHFKAVCFALSMYGDYETGTSIRPSWLTVASDASVNRKTAMKVRDVLLDIGLLIQVGKTEGNISKYEFGSINEIPTPEQLSISKEQLSINEEQLSTFDEQLSNIDGHNITINTTKEITLIVPEEAVASSKVSFIKKSQEEEVVLGNNYISPDKMYELTSSLWS